MVKQIRISRKSWCESSIAIMTLVVLSNLSVRHLCITVAAMCCHACICGNATAEAVTNSSLLP